MRERLCEARNSAERFELLEIAFMSRLHDGARQHYAVSAALEIFGNSQAVPSVQEIARHLGLSQRRFIEVFKAEVGLTPKLFTRIGRFQRARKLIHDHASPDWAGIALELGYFDQSHFIREFQEFAGLTPTDYLDRQQQSVSGR